MKARILNVTSETCEVLALSIVSDEDGALGVELKAWHWFENLDYEQSHIVWLNSMPMCERFIADYSPTSAQDFVDSFNF